MPQRLGGLGYQQAATAAYPRFLTQTARAIHLASSTENPIPAVHQRHFTSWKDSTNEHMTKFRKALSLFANEQAEESLFVPSR